MQHMGASAAPREGGVGECLYLLDIPRLAARRSPQDEELRSHVRAVT